MGSGFGARVDQEICSAALGMWKESGRRIRLQVATDSMMPIIRPGDSVIIRMGNVDRVRPGDIVAYTRNDRVFVHRLLRVTLRGGHRCFWQQGDALSGWGSFDEEAFVGMVESVYRGRTVLHMDREPWRVINRGVGLLGMIRIKALETARWLRHRKTGRRKSTTNR